MKFLSPAITAALFVALPTFAQQSGSWLVKMGGYRIEPQVKSGDLTPPSLPGTKIDVGGATGIHLSAAYMCTENLSVELSGGVPPTHDIELAGTLAGAGKIATMKQISPVLLAQYRWGRSDFQVRPYVGLGVMRAHFYAAKGSPELTALTQPGGPDTQVSVRDAWGSAFQIGSTFRLDSRWFLDVALMKVFLATSAKLSTGQSIRARLDPVAGSVAIGYRF